MAHAPRTIKITEQTHAWLRLIAALTGEMQYQVVERLAKAELDRLQQRKRPR